MSGTCSAPMNCVMSSVFIFLHYWTACPPPPPPPFVCHNNMNFAKAFLGLKTKTPTRFLSCSRFERMFISLLLAEKLQDAAIKVSTSSTYWNSFPALCPPLSQGDVGSWQSVLCLQQSILYVQAKDTFFVCADKHIVVVYLIDLKKACCPVIFPASIMIVFFSYIPQE